MEILQGMTDMLHNQERKSKGENRKLIKENSNNRLEAESAPWPLSNFD